jgi:PleD family two-component response regulator
LKSDLNVGSKFWFYIEDTSEGDSLQDCSPTIPKEFRSESGVARKINNPNLQIHICEGCECPSISIADDDAFNLMVLENVLTSLGYSLMTAYNGKEVLNVVESRLANPCCEEC